MLTFVAVGFQTLDLGGGGDDFSAGDYERKLAEQQLLRERIKQQKEQNRLRKALSMKQKQQLGSQAGVVRCSGHVAPALLPS